MVTTDSMCNTYIYHIQQISTVASDGLPEVDLNVGELSITLKISRIVHNINANKYIEKILVANHWKVILNLWIYRKHLRNLVNLTNQLVTRYK